MKENFGFSKEKTNYSGDFFSKNSITFLISFLVIGFIIRLNYFPFDIPFEQDALDFFEYAVKTKNSGMIPHDWFLANNGWSLFLATFFSFIHLDTFLDYVYLQRILSIIMSVITIVPVYFFCKKFFDRKTALIGGALFIFNPFIIDSSILAGTHTIFIFTGIIAFYFFLRDSPKSTYISFAVIGVLAVIRYEGLILLIPFTILYFIKFRNESKYFLKYVISLSFFLIIILPFSIIDLNNFGEDGLVSHIFSNLKHVDKHIIQEEYSGDNWTDEIEGNVSSNFVLKGFENIFKFLGFGLFPILLFLVPYGIFKIFKNIDQQKLFIIAISVTLLIPAFYAYARDFQDIKFLLIMYPIFSLLSLYIIEKIYHVTTKTNAIIIILLFIIIISSIIMLEINKIDYEYERDSFIVANKVVEISEGYLVYSPESRYIKSAEAELKWPDVLPNNKDGHVIRDKTLRFKIDFSENNLSWKYNLGEETFSSKKFETLYELFSSLEQEGLTHIIIDEKENRAKFLSEAFLNPKKFPFLKEVYNSSSEQLSYNVKIFEIHYNKLEHGI